MEKKKPSTKRNNTILLIGGGLLAAGAITYFMSGNTGVPVKEVPDGSGGTPQPNPGTQTPALNLNLILKRGSKGMEVRELQKLLKVGIDGDFGPLTEAALWSVRSLKQISVNQYNSTPIKVPPIPQTPFVKGQNLMASIRSGSRLYACNKDASGKWFIESNVHESIEDFGKALGKIVAVLSASGQYFYIVERSGIISNSYRAVRHTESKAY